MDGSARITLDCYGEAMAPPPGSRIVDLNGVPVGEYYAAEGLTARLIDGSVPQQNGHHQHLHHHGGGLHGLQTPATSAQQIAQYRPWEAKDGFEAQLHLVTTMAAG
jgi:hypothetical protein